MTVIDRLWQQIEPVVFITRGEFERGLADWEIEPVGDPLAFAVLTRGPELHFASFDTGARITPRMIWSRLDAIMARHGFVTTRTEIEDVKQQRLNRRLGFVETGRDEFFLFSRLDKKCQ